MKLLRELSEDVEYFVEEKNGLKEHFIHGIFMQTNIPNRNKRFYEMRVVEPEVNRYINEVVKDNRGYGELGHPPGPQINLPLVSHLITELVRDGDNFIGKAKLADTPMGNTAKGLLGVGAKLGVSSRGMGSLIESKRDGHFLVQGDYRLVTAGDIVADPSAPNAFVNSIMEGADWVFDANTGEYIQEHLDNTRKALRQMPTRMIESKAVLIFENYLTLLASKH